VINQLTGEYECKDDILRSYHEECIQLLSEFKIVKVKHIPKWTTVKPIGWLKERQAIGRL
jgi:hypothetical protein